MPESSSEAVLEAVTQYIAVTDADERIRKIGEIGDVLQRELLKTHMEIPDMACPSCGCTSCIRYGKTRAGTQRWKCTGCGKVRCHIETGSILAYTKLDDGKWMDYATCFVDSISCDRVAERIGVCHKTAWFMRLRTLQAIFVNLPSFQVKSGNGTVLDEMFFHESFKGTRFEGMEYMPREPRQENTSDKRGISNDQICVLTAFNDTDDFFFEVCCRGPLTSDIAMNSLENRICSGAIVYTDQNKAYPRVLKELAVASHTAINSKDHSGLGR